MNKETIIGKCNICSHPAFVRFIDGSQICLFHHLHHNLTMFPVSEHSLWWKEEIARLSGSNGFGTKEKISAQEWLNKIFPMEIRPSVTHLDISGPEEKQD